jgi:hypothetical protein
MWCETEFHGANDAVAEIPSKASLLVGVLVRQPHFVTFAAFPLVKAVYLLKS